MAELDTNTTAKTETAQEPEKAAPINEGNKDESAELKKLREELAKQKAATDKATKEAAESKRQLRAKQTAEEAQAEEAKAQQEALMQELETLRKERAIASTKAKIVQFVGDETAAGQIAECLYGAEDVESAIAEFQKAWTAKEKALRLEYGKIQAPGVGASGGPSVTKEQLDGMKYQERVRFAREHPAEYNKLMGR